MRNSQPWVLAAGAWAAILAAGAGCRAIMGMEDGEPIAASGFAGSGGHAGGGGDETGGAGAAAAGGVGGSAGGPECMSGAMQDCYEGPEGTDNVGICHGGTKTCSADGSWGPCEGQQLPESEDCTAADDEDCDGVPCSEHVWSLMAGGTGSDWILSIATDGSGNSVITGGFTSAEINLGGANLPNAGSRDIFVAMYDAAGNHLWSRRFGQSGYDYGAVVAFDSAGDVVVTGQCADSGTYGAIDFGGTAGSASCSGSDTFFAKLAATDGSAQWVTVFGGSAGGNRVPRAMALDSGDKILIGGSFLGSMGGCGGSSNGNDAFIRKYDAAGTVVEWTNCYGEAGTDHVRSIAIAPADDVFIGGTFSAEIALDQTWTSPQGEYFGYVAKLAGADGMPDWSRSLGASGTSEQTVNSVSVDSSGAVVVTGRSVGALSLSSSTVLLGSGVQWDAFVARYAANGTHLWGKLFEDHPMDGRQYAEMVAVDAADNIVIAGGFQSAVDFGGGDLITTGSDDIFVVKLDATGAHLWSKGFGSSTVDKGRAVAVNSADQVAMAGYAEGGIDFGSGSELPYSASHDLFVVLFQP